MGGMLQWAVGAGLFYTHQINIVSEAVITQQVKL